MTTQRTLESYAEPGPLTTAGPGTTAALAALPSTLPDLIVAVQRLLIHEPGSAQSATGHLRTTRQILARRFHYIVNFPRPGLAERERIWRVVFPPDTPLADDVDLTAMATLDMTGASISGGAARTAAVLAADRGDPSITMIHVVHAVRRQYDRDARLLHPAELGQFARLADPR
jgi:hypothetical protein